MQPWSSCGRRFALSLRSESKCVHLEPFNNLLLSSLSKADRTLLAPDLNKLELTRRQVLIEADVPINFVYFLEDGIASIVNTFEDGSEAEIGICGREGMAGTIILLGAEQSPFQTYMQLDGVAAHRIGARALQQAMAKSASLAKMLLRYAQAAAIQSSHTAAVNSRFDIPHRLARWLLMCHDRIDGDAVYLTHEKISIMLGVRRSGVTEAIADLEELGVIKGRRGFVEITRRQRLRAFAGSAYGISEREYRRLIGPFGKDASRVQ
jgi:CRP-like cAMP-binding protein